MGPEYAALAAALVVLACLAGGFAVAAWGYAPRLQQAEERADLERTRREEYERLARARSLGAREDLAKDRELRAAVGGGADADAAWDRLLQLAPTRAELAAAAGEPGAAGPEGAPPGAAGAGGVA